MCDLLINICCH
jgi:hypothetical protein